MILNIIFVVTIIIVLIGALIGVLLVALLPSRDRRLQRRIEVQPKQEPYYFIQQAETCQTDNILIEGDIDETEKD